MSGAVLGKASHAHKCRDYAPYFAHARSAVTPRAFAMRMLIDIVGVVVIERARGSLETKLGARGVLKPP